MHVTVALNGDGGDESFAGYTRYVSNVAAARLDAMPRPLRRLAGAVRFAGARERPDRLPASRVRRLSESISLDAARAIPG